MMFSVQHFRATTIYFILAVDDTNTGDERFLDGWLLDTYSPARRWRISYDRKD